MNSPILQSYCEATGTKKSMQEFGEIFIESLPRHLRSLKIPGRAIDDGLRREPLLVQVEKTADIQQALHEVLVHPLTQEAHTHAENTFNAFLAKNEIDEGLLKFFNGWNETHKTTSLVSAKIIMRLSADAVSIPADISTDYNNVLAHMYEVVKDDFGLGHEGHDGMYGHMTAAFDAQGWVDSQYKIDDCEDFSGFLYEIGVAKHKSPINSFEHRNSVMDAMMVSTASEFWNGREYNFIAQYIENKLISFNPSLKSNIKNFRNAKNYIFGHSGEVENKHGLHALAAAQTYSRTVDLKFDVDRMKNIMLDYNKRVGKAFNSLHAALTTSS